MTTPSQNIIADARTLKRVGRPKGGGGTGYDPVTDKAGGARRYLAGRIKRDRPDLAARIEAGEITIKAAAIEAGYTRRSITIPAGTGAAGDAARLILKQGDDYARMIATILTDAIGTTRNEAEGSATSCSVTP